MRLVASIDRYLPGVYCYPFYNYQVLEQIIAVLSEAEVALLQGLLLAGPAVTEHLSTLS
jgi:hypothetical protein